MSAEQKQELQIHTSSFSIFSPNTLPWSVLYSQNKLTELGTLAKFDGMEVVPPKMLMFGVVRSAFDINFGLLSPDAKNYIASGHQSPRGPIGIHNVTTQYPWLIFQEREQSIHSLSRLQKTIAHHLPLVFYEGSESRTAHHDFLYSMLQPHPGLIEYAHAKDLGQLVQFIKDCGAYVCLDTHHLRRENTFLADWQTTIPALLPYTKEVHVALGRLDSPDSHIDTFGELNDIQRGTHNTSIREILGLIGSQWSGPVVIEIPATAFGPNLTPKRFVHENRIIVTEVANAMLGGK